jgi:hypothetical protein
MREITHLVLLSRVSCGIAKKLTEHELRLASGDCSSHRKKMLSGAPRRTVGVGIGSECEELNVSKSSPLHPVERTSMRRAAISLMGQQRKYQHH